MDIQEISERPTQELSQTIPAKDRKFKSVEEYFSQLKHSYITVDTIGLCFNQEEEFIIYLECLDQIISCLSKDDRQKVKSTLSEVKNWENFIVTVDAISEKFGYPKLNADNSVTYDDLKIEKDKRLGEIEFCIFSINMNYVQKLKSMVKPAVYNYLMRACRVVWYRNQASFMSEVYSRNLESQEEMVEYGDADEDEIETLAIHQDVISRFEGAIQFKDAHRKAKKPSRGLTEFEKELVDYAEGIIEFDPQCLKGFVDMDTFRSLNEGEEIYYNNDDPEEFIIEHYYNSLYTLSYEGDDVKHSLQDSYVEDLQLHEREGFFFFCFTEMARYYPDKVVGNPNREECIAGAYRYFNAFDGLYNLLKNKMEWKASIH